jgi:hypothetical protein
MNNDAAIPDMPDGSTSDGAPAATDADRDTFRTVDDAREAGWIGYGDAARAVESMLLDRNGFKGESYSPPRFAYVDERGHILARIELVRIDPDPDEPFAYALRATVHPANARKDTETETFCRTRALWIETCAVPGRRRGSYSPRFYRPHLLASARRAASWIAETVS